MFSFGDGDSDLRNDRFCCIFRLRHERLFSCQIVFLLFTAGCRGGRDPLGVICSDRDIFLFDGVTDLLDELNDFRTSCSWSCRIGKLLSDDSLSATN